MTRSLRTWVLGLVGVVAIGSLAAQSQVPGVNSTLNAVFNLVYDNSTMKPTYSAVRVIATASSATDVCALAGSASKNVRIRKVELSGLSTSVVAEHVGIIKRSAAPSGGTGGMFTSIPYDTVNSLTGSTTNAATAIAEYWTANPTVGTIVGFIADPVMPFRAATAGNNDFNLVLDFGTLGSPVVLRGVAQSLAVNLNGITISGGEITCRFEWTEE